ncbi:hypothetical protein [Rhodococcus phenolicus]|uniref:hypothetical protein n=1 Tax=Rhodococcus phenolicus TaxID=263849 RepID=UPI00083356F7|nr:hypothetical protein [Rhodococcus phenolicus]
MRGRTGSVRPAREYAASPVDVGGRWSARISASSTRWPAPSRDGSQSAGRSEAGRLRSGARAAVGSAACVIVPSWMVSGSVGVAVAATLAILFAVAAASIMI